MLCFHLLYGQIYLLLLGEQIMDQRRFMPIIINSFMHRTHLCLSFCLIKIQATTHIKFRSTSTDAVRSRHNSEKETFVLEKYRKLGRGELSCILSYTFQPLISRCIFITEPFRSNMRYAILWE